MKLTTPNVWAYCTDSWSGNPATNPGTSVALGASNADGAVTALIGTALTHDVEMLDVMIISGMGATSTTDTSALLDIVIDPAGGTSWDTTNRLITSLMCGYMPSASGGQLGVRRWQFPVHIGAGATVGGVGRNITGSAGTALVILRAYGGPSGRWWSGQKVDAIGEVRASSGGTTVTPNATINTFASWGAGTNFGSATARRYKALIPSVCGVGTVTNHNHQMQIGISDVQVGPIMDYYHTTSEQCSGIIGGSPLIWCDVPEGSQLDVRIRSSSASSNNQQVIIHGVA